MTSTGDTAQYIADLEQEIAALKAETQRIVSTYNRQLDEKHDEIAALKAKLAEALAEIREVYDALNEQIPYVVPGQTPTGFRAREASRLLKQRRAEREPK
jgi:hypothetical protein